MVPAENEDAQPEATSEPEADESPAIKEHSFWSDSDYSSDTSFRSSSPDDSSKDKSQPASSSRSSRQRATPNPLLQAFPVRSDQGSALAIESHKSGMAEHGTDAKKGM